MSRVLLPFLVGALLFFTNGCRNGELNQNANPIRLIVLGNVQDAGSPHIACEKKCCIHLSTADKQERRVTCLGLIDDSTNQQFLIEATPDIESQLRDLNRHANEPANKLPDAIAITHAHIGHYTGLAYVGKEGIHSENLPVLAMPRMEDFLHRNGPWNQLLKLNNIQVRPLRDHKTASLSKNFSIIPLRVPHRDEYSETVGFKIIGPNRTALFIPDIDKWHLWQYPIDSMVRSVDLAFLDATFYSSDELPHRDIKDIPHPLVTESTKLLQNLPQTHRNKVYFIHLNHTNPLLNKISKESVQIREKGFHVARLDDAFEM